MGEGCRAGRWRWAARTRTWSSRDDGERGQKRNINRDTQRHKQLTSLNTDPHNVGGRACADGVSATGPWCGLGGWGGNIHEGRHCHECYCQRVPLSLSIFILITALHLLHHHPASRHATVTRNPPHLALCHVRALAAAHARADGHSRLGARHVPLRRTALPRLQDALCPRARKGHVRRPHSARRVQGHDGRVQLVAAGGPCL